VDAGPIDTLVDTLWHFEELESVRELTRMLA
jgi:hypothetical protein